MSAQLAELERVEVRASARVDPRDDGIDTGWAAESTDNAPARGIMVAAMIAAPFWALVAFTFYLLM